MELKKIFSIGLVLVLLIFIMGCGSQQKKEENQSNDKDSQQKKEENQSNDKAQENRNTTTEIIKGGETKPGEEQVKEQVKAIADGIYEGKVNYAYPAGEEKKGTNTIGIVIEVQNEVIKQASIVAINEPDNTSKNFIKGVNNALPELVVGKKITELNLPKQIAGSSLTTEAFRSYVAGLIESEKSKNFQS